MVLWQDNWTTIILNPQRTPTWPEIIDNTLEPKQDFIYNIIEYTLLYWLIFILLKILFEFILNVDWQWAVTNRGENTFINALSKNG